MCLRAVLVRAPRDLAFTYVNLFCARMCLHPFNEKMRPSTCVARAQTCVCTHAYLRRCTQLCVYTRTARRARARIPLRVYLHVLCPSVSLIHTCLHVVACAYIRVCDVTDTYVSPRTGRRAYVYLSVRKRKWPCGCLPFLLQTHMRVRSCSENVGQHAWLSHTCASDARRNVCARARLCAGLRARAIVRACWFLRAHTSARDICAGHRCICVPRLVSGHMCYSLRAHARSSVRLRILWCAIHALHAIRSKPKTSPLSGGCETHCSPRVGACGMLLLMKTVRTLQAPKPSQKRL